MVLRWKNPSDKDLKEVIINSNELTISSKNNPASSYIGTTQSIEIPIPPTELDKGTYTFIAVTRDKGNNDCTTSNRADCVIKLPTINNFSVPNAKAKPTGRFTVVVNGKNFQSPVIQNSDFNVYSENGKYNPQEIRIISDTKLEFDIDYSIAVTTETMKLSCIGSSIKEDTFEVKDGYSLCDIVMSDDTILTAAKCANYCGTAKPVAMIAIAKTSTQPAKGIGFFIEHCAWAAQDSFGHTHNFSNIIDGQNSDMDGSDNWREVCNLDTTAQGQMQTNYPAFYFANTYGNNFSGSDFATGWYLPAQGELVSMGSVANFNQTRDAVKAKFQETGKSYIGMGANLWSSNQSDARKDQARSYYLGNDYKGESKYKNDAGAGGADMMHASAMRKFE